MKAFTWQNRAPTVTLAECKGESVISTVTMINSHCTKNKVWWTSFFVALFNIWLGAKVKCSSDSCSGKLQYLPEKVESVAPKTMLDNSNTWQSLKEKVYPQARTILERFKNCFLDFERVLFRSSNQRFA